MQRILSLTRGIVRIEINCRYPERFINICAANEISFWNLEQIDSGALRVFITAAGFRQLRALSSEHGFAVMQIKKSGAPVIMRRLRRRYILVAGLVFILLATRITSLFVWDIRLTGNERVSRAVIMESLKTLGFSHGTFGWAVDSELLGEQMKLLVPELSWFAVNIRGSRADVMVRERIPAPEVIDLSVPAMVMARKSGIITKISVLEGRPLVSVGQTVEMGETLVTGVLDSTSGRVRTVHAMAEIEARTWYELSARMTVEATVKRFVGERKVKNSLVFGEKRINFFVNSSIPWLNYDKIVVEKHVHLPMGVSLPITLVSERYERYDPIVTEQSRERVEQTLKYGLEQRLRAEIGDGDVLAIGWDVREADGVMTVTLFSECLEQIAVSRPLAAFEEILG